ncbi:hypothetical protein Salat_1562800 [Sesamum alatum]|uniref:Uncharacterized protein n=1 Tax=Sesamum alatum TaxID=300844 RepID=A0AAE2CMT2_9LAMI|nr:hypothetical protein Salat_1562800 [Sesamum alatum]
MLALNDWSSNLTKGDSWGSLRIKITSATPTELASMQRVAPNVAPHNQYKWDRISHDRNTHEPIGICKCQDHLCCGFSSTMERRLLLRMLNFRKPGKGDSQTGPNFLKMSQETGKEGWILFTSFNCVHQMQTLTRKMEACIYDDQILKLKELQVGSIGVHRLYNMVCGVGSNVQIVAEVI